MLIQSRGRSHGSFVNSGGDTINTPDISYHTFSGETLNAGPPVTVTGGTGRQLASDNDVSSFSLTNDPTGTPSLRIDYPGNATRSLRIDVLSAQYAGLGSTRYVYGKVYLPVGIVETSLYQRKLMYFTMGTTDLQAKMQFVLTRRGDMLQLIAERINPDTSTTSLGGNLTTTTLGTAFEVEIQLTMNSAQDANDGVLRVWVDRVLRLENTAARFTASGWGYADADLRWSEYNVGDQLQNDGGSAAQEYRYWQRVGLSTARIAP